MIDNNDIAVVVNVALILPWLGLGILCLCLSIALLLHKILKQLEKGG